jgi:hypothetical protein
VVRCLGVGLGRPDTEIVGSRHGCLSIVLCRPVYVEALRRADHSRKESYQIPKKIHDSISNSELEKVKRPHP